MTTATHRILSLSSEAESTALLLLAVRARPHESTWPCSGRRGSRRRSTATLIT